MHNLFTTENSSNPFPVSFEEYNKFEFYNDINLWLPIKPNKPFIFEQKNLHVFIYVENSLFLINYLLNNVEFENIENIEMLSEDLVDIIDFQENENLINMIILDNNKMKTFYFKKEKNKNTLIRFLKGFRNRDSEAYNIELFMDLNRKSKFFPIEKKTISSAIVEKWYHINPDNNKLYLSFDLKEDFPYEIISEDNIKKKDYLIPNVKKIRTKFYRPSYVVYDNNKLIDYKYLFNNTDVTDNVKEILKKHNIKNPDLEYFNDSVIQDINNIKNKIKAL